MSRKISITLDDEILNFIDQRTNNRSSFINEILWHEKQRSFVQELAEAYRDQSSDPALLEEASAWDVTAGDGLDA
jgi:metal-responsive CopG/Arc/MetJ family transcriptional regulator